MKKTINVIATLIVLFAFVGTLPVYASSSVKIDADNLFASCNYSENTYDAVPSLAGPSNGTTKNKTSLVADLYGLLGETYKASLEARLEAISQKHEAEIAIVIVDGLDGKTPMEFADDYYDFNGFGKGDSRDGAVLLLSMAERDWWFSTSGKAIRIFNDSAIDSIFRSDDGVLSFFGVNNFEGGFDCFADECDKCLTAFENGKKYPPTDPKVYVFIFMLNILIGIVVAVIFIHNEKKKYKNVRFCSEANDYLVNNSLRLTKFSTQFLYTNIIRTERPQDNNSGGGSTHMSSSGSYHGGSGGKF